MMLKIDGAISAFSRVHDFEVCFVMAESRLLYSVPRFEFH